VTDRRGRPKIISDEDLLNLIKRDGEISQRDLKELTGLKKSTLSMIIKHLFKQGKIKVRNVRDGRSTLSLVTLNTFDQPHTPVTPSIRPKIEEEEQRAPDFNPRLTDPAFLKDLLTNGGFDEAIIDLLGESTVLGLADAHIEDLIKGGIPSEIAKDLLQFVEEYQKLLSNQF